MQNSTLTPTLGLWQNVGAFGNDNTPLLYRVVFTIPKEEYHE